MSLILKLRERHAALCTELQCSTCAAVISLTPQVSIMTVFGMQHDFTCLLPDTDPVAACIFCISDFVSMPKDKVISSDDKAHERRLAVFLQVRLRLELTRHHGQVCKEHISCSSRKRIPTVRQERGRQDT